MPHPVFLPLLKQLLEAGSPEQREPSGVVHYAHNWLVRCLFGPRRYALPCGPCPAAKLLRVAIET